MQQLVKMRVLNRYRGQEAEQFRHGNGAVPEGGVIRVTPERARQLIANGNAAPIIGPSETKPAGPAEKKAPGGTDGSAVPPSSSPADPASQPQTVPRSLGARMQRVGEQLQSKTTSASSRRRTPSTGAIPTGGSPNTPTGESTSRS